MAKLLSARWIPSTTTATSKISCGKAISILCLVICPADSRISNKYSKISLKWLWLSAWRKDFEGLLGVRVKTMQFSVEWTYVQGENQAQTIINPVALTINLKDSLTVWVLCSSMSIIVLEVPTIVLFIVSRKMEKKKPVKIHFIHRCNQKSKNGPTPL